MEVCGEAFGKSRRSPLTAVTSRITMASSSHASVPLQTFNLTNQIKEIDPQDAIFRHDEAENKRINAEAPWKKECVLRSRSREEL